MPDSNIKILIVSRTPWNEANSFGNTFSNLFEGIGNVKIANICCQGGIMNSRLIDKSFQLTDKDVAMSILGSSPGHVIRNGIEIHSSRKTIAPRKTFFYVLREVIWAIGRWKSKALKRFIMDFKPDILYLPIYRSHYMCQVDKYLIKMSGVPYVVHISDDIYGFSPKASGLEKQLQRVIRKDIRHILSGAAYGEVFSPVMAKEYHAEFKIPFHVIGKSVDTMNLPPILKKKTDKPIRFVYTGNYGGERGSQLVQLAKSITEAFTQGVAVLDIYSASKGDDEIDKQLRNIECVNLKGSVSPDKILSTQQQADYLVHVEGFTPEAIFESRLSFSTKIIDYLLAARPILAIGPKEVTSVHVLKENRMAYVATNLSELKDILIHIAQEDTDNEKMVANGRNYLITNRDAAKIKKDMLQRLQLLVKK